MRTFRIFLGFAVLLSILIPFQKIRSATPSPYDLIAVVNDLRKNNGLPAMAVDDSLMAAAQMQSDYLGSQYGTSFPSWDMGHIGAGGSIAVDRAVASGYVVGSGWNVVENWAGGNSTTTLSDIVYGQWNDAAHMGNMLHPDVVHVGAGVTEGSGYVYVIMDFGVQYGSGRPAGGGVASTVPTTAVTPRVAPVAVASADEDGSIIHEVQAGQALWSIAAAYDVTVDQLLALNNLSANAIIYVGQSLLVRLPYTPTPEPEATLTSRPPTRTPIPAQTAQAVITPQPTEDPSENGFLGLSRQTMGLVLILVCGVGLVLIVVGTMTKNKPQKTPPTDQDPTN